MKRYLWSLTLATTAAIAVTPRVYQVDVSWSNVNMGTLGVQGYLNAVDNAPPGTYNDSVTAVVGSDDSYVIFDVDSSGIPTEQSSGMSGSWNDGNGDCDGHCFFEPY